jgi:flagellar biosynthesis protein FlhF
VPSYKFTVRSADEAVRAIRERLGENAKVLSVRQVGGEGLTGLFSKPKLEVIAEVDDVPAASNASDPGGRRSVVAVQNGDGRIFEENGGDGAPPSIRENTGASVPADARSAALFRSDEAASPTGLASAVLPPPASARTAPSKTATTTGARLPELLRRAGFSEASLGRLQTSETFTAALELPLHRALAEMGGSLRQAAAKRLARPLPARTAFLGTPGVGRTTALCKWLAREIFSKGRGGRVVKVEFDRPNPAEGLAVFCEALGLSLEHYAAPLEPTAAATPTVPTLSELAPGTFLYADVPGLSLRAPNGNTALARFLDREKFLGRVLVLNAAYDLPMLRRAYAAGRDLGATHLVFTHLDELEHWGKLWDFLFEGDLTPLFLGTGASLTGDCEENAFDAILRRTLPGA